MNNAKLTITEALAEIKTVKARVDKKQQSILQHIGRQACLSDPFKNDGGSPKFIEQEMQSVKDLFERQVKLRNAINKANDSTTLTIGDNTRTIAEWLVWRREVSASENAFLNNINNNLRNLRNQAAQQKVQAVPVDGKPSSDFDVIVNVNEKKLLKSSEDLQTALSTLDGQLSLKNATTTIEV